MTQLALRSTKIAFATLSSLSKQNLAFDRKAKTSTISKLLESLQPSDAMSYLDDLIRIFSDCDVKDKMESSDHSEGLLLQNFFTQIIAVHVHKRRVIVMDQLLSLSSIKSRDQPKEHEKLMSSILHFLFFHSFYTFEPISSSINSSEKEYWVLLSFHLIILIESFLSSSSI